MKKSDFQQISQPKIIQMKFITNDSFEKNNNFEINIELKSKVEINDEISEGKVCLDILLNGEEFFEKAPFKFEAQVVCDYSFSKSVKEEEKNTFFNSIVPSMLLSYTRPIISQLTTYAGMPPCIIPLVNLKNGLGKEKST